MHEGRKKKSFTENRSRGDCLFGINRSDRILLLAAITILGQRLALQWGQSSPF
jgi:hypothetical protein